MSAGSSAGDEPGASAGAEAARSRDLAAALEIVGARWALLIVARLLDGPQRYGDLQRDLGVPTNILATRLRELEEAGVVRRLPLKHNTRAYAVTARGEALRDAVEALARWGADRANPGDGSPLTRRGGTRSPAR